MNKLGEATGANLNAGAIQTSPFPPDRAAVPADPAARAKAAVEEMKLSHDSFIAEAAELCKQADHKLACARALAKDLRALGQNPTPRKPRVKKVAP